MHKQNEKFKEEKPSKKKKYPTKTNTETLELKNTIIKLKNSIERFMNNFNKAEEESVNSKISPEINQLKKQNGKK